MILFVLGLLDIISAIILGLLIYGIGTSVGFYFGVYEILKGLVFFRSLVSFLDIFAGVFIILATFGYQTAFTWIFVLWLLQKGFFSFFRG